MIRQLILGFILLGVLSACGQKGDLYLPDKQSDKKPNKTTQLGFPAI